ncbi:hypothetical protein P4050_18880 [Pseudomonas aeruginosa]|nr:hypothetical protein [Pseudomonas aeruginosa]
MGDFQRVVAGYADGWFTGGYVEWQVDGDNYDRRYIERHAGADLHILGGTEGVPAGATAGLSRLRSAR